MQFLQVEGGGEAGGNGEMMNGTIVKGRDKQKAYWLVHKVVVLVIGLICFIVVSLQIRKLVSQNDELIAAVTGTDTATESVSENAPIVATIENEMTNYASALLDLKDKNCTRFSLDGVVVDNYNRTVDVGNATSGAQLALHWCPEAGQQYSDATVFIELPRSYYEKSQFKILGQASAGFASRPMINQEMIEGQFIFQSAGDSGSIDIAVPRYDIRAVEDSNVDRREVEKQLSPSVILSLPVLPEYTNLTKYGNDTSTQDVIDIIDIGEMLTSRSFYTTFGSPYYGDEFNKIIPSLVRITDAMMKDKTMMVMLDILESDDEYEGNIVYRGIWLNLWDLGNTPMSPRVADKRIGYFSDCFKAVGGRQEYEDDLSEALQLQDESICYVNRWRLEPKEKGCKSSCEAKKEVRYFIDPSVPPRWRKCLARSVDSWNVAFVQAGWKNGTIRGILPDDEEWPEDYHPLDPRYSSISWTFNEAGYAVGPSETDRRTGEILNADIVVDGSWVKYMQGYWNHFWTDEIEGDDQRLRLESYGLAGSIFMSNQIPGSFNTSLLFDYVCNGLTELVMHEVGHTIGLRHNFRGSYAYSNEERNSTQTSASVMDYMDYIWKNETLSGQIPFMSEPGEYDVWAIRYGYSIVDSEEEVESIANEEDRAYGFCTDEDVDRMDPSCSRYDLSNNTGMIFV